jgi:hypothetical protein
MNALNEKIGGWSSLRGQRCNPVSLFCAGLPRRLRLLAMAKGGWTAALCAQ